MLRPFIVLPLTLLLSVSPILPSIATYICCCEGAPGDFNLHLQEDGQHDHDHGADNVSSEVSLRSDDDGEHHHSSHHEHDGDQVPAIGLASSDYPNSSVPSSCSCEQADPPNMEILATAYVGKVGRKSTTITSSHAASAIRMVQDRPYHRAYAADAKDLLPSVTHIFLLNRALLI